MGEQKTQPQPEQQKAAEAANEFAALMAKPFVPMGAENEPFSTPERFEHVWRVAKAYATSGMVPESFRGNDKVADCAIGVALAWRHKADPLMVLQHIHIIKGRPGMDAQLAIAFANSSGKLAGAITHEFTRDENGKAIGCTARAVLASTGEVIVGSEITLAMAKAENWGPKWQSMPDHMLRFRSSVFMLREYLPEVLMGMYTTDELVDIPITETAAPSDAALDVLRDRVRARVASVQPSAAAAKPEPPAEPAKPKAKAKAAAKAEPAAEKAPAPEPAELPPMVADPTILDDYPIDPADERDECEPEEPVEPGEQTALPLDAGQAAKPKPVPQNATTAPAMTAREQLIAQVRDLCEAQGKRLPPVTRMSDEALKGYAKTLSTPAK